MQQQRERDSNAKSSEERSLSDRLTKAEVKDPSSDESLDCLQSLGRLYQRQRDYEKAFSIFDDLLIRTSRRFGKLSPEVTNAMDMKSAVFVQRGNLTAAEPMLLSALERRQKTCLPNDSDVFASLMNLGDFYRLWNNPSKSAKYFQQALDWSKSSQLDSLSILEPMNKLAGAIFAQGKVKEAARIWTNCISLVESKNSIDDPALRLLYRKLASCYRAQGLDSLEYKTVDKLMNNLIRINDDYPGVASCLSDLIEINNRRKLRRNNEMLYLQILAIYQKHLDANNAEIARQQDCLASLYIDEHRCEEAQILWRRSLKIREAITPKSETAEIIRHYAKLFAASGDSSTADTLTTRSSQTRNEGP